MPVLEDSSIMPFLPEGLPLSIVGVIATVLIGVIYSILARERPLAGFPLASLEGQTPKKSWLHHGKETLVEGLQKYPNAFQIMTSTGPKIVLPNRFADELRNHPDLNFNKAFQKDFFPNYPGFEALKQGLHDDALIQETVRIKLTQFLNLVTNDLVDETTAALHDIYGDDDAEWKTISLKNTMLDLVARLSSRVFLGKSLCRNERWLEIAKRYTVDLMVGSFMLHKLPTLLRPLLHWFLPPCISLRRAVKDAHKLIDPEVSRRTASVDAALAAGQKPPKRADTIGWMHEISQTRTRRVEYVEAQLSLTFAAIHTTTETTCRALLDVCAHPEAVEPLRKEIVEVLSQFGWAKTSLYKLKLMDSFLKESQRCAPLSMTTMNRVVEKDVQLSDGTLLPRGSRVMVVGDYMDPVVYSSPSEFDAARFLKLRQEPGNENSWQFVTTSSQHMIFGHGQHACPGRFFASNEIKIALCHLLLKYDWRFVPGEEPSPSRWNAASQSIDPATRVQYRRRKEEINLDIEM